MGGNPYLYLVPYDPNPERAVLALQRQELEAGRYDPCYFEKTGSFLFQLDLGDRMELAGPGGCHATIDEAREAGEESGTNSILDVYAVRTKPFVEWNFETADTEPPDSQERFGAAAPLAEHLIKALFVSGEPTRDEALRLLTQDLDSETLQKISHLARTGDNETALALSPEWWRKQCRFWNLIGRGEVCFFPLFKDGAPVEYFIAGYSVD